MIRWSALFVNDVRNQLGHSRQEKIHGIYLSGHSTLACKRRRLDSRAKSPYFGGHSKYPGNKKCKATMAWERHVSKDLTQGKCYIMPAARTPCTLPSWACEAWNGVECIKPCDQVPFSVNLHDPHDTPESLSLPILQLFELHSSNSRRSLVTQVSTFFPYAFWQWIPIHTPSAKLVAPRVYGKRVRTTNSCQPTETQQMIP